MPERYGHEVDQYSAEIMDRLDAAFEEHASGWKIASHRNLAINRNRHMIVKDVSEYNTPEGKLPSEVFAAVRSAGLQVSGVYTDVKGEATARVWVTIPDGKAVDFAQDTAEPQMPTENH